VADRSRANVPPVSLSNVPPIAVSNVPHVPFLNWSKRYAIQKCDKVFTSYFVVLELDDMCN
jgi:hypothetical protein